MKDSYLCKICNDGKIYRGLMAFAAHFPPNHKMSALTYWKKYGYRDSLDKSQPDLDEREIVVFT